MKIDWFIGPFQIRTVCVNASTMNQADKLDEKQMASVSIAVVLVFVTSNLLQNLYFVLRYYKVISPEQDLSKKTPCINSQNYKII